MAFFADKKNENVGPDLHINTDKEVFKRKALHLGNNSTSMDGGEY